MIGVAVIAPLVLRAGQASVRADIASPSFIVGVAAASFDTCIYIADLELGKPGIRIGGGTGAC
jgi:hypothetical protein